MNVDAWLYGILPLKTIGVTDEGQRCEPPPWQAKSKNRAVIAYISVFNIPLAFSRLLFFPFFVIFTEYFFADFGFHHGHLH